MKVLHAMNLALRFAIEISALGLLSLWGFGAHTDTVDRWLFGLGGPVLFTVTWGLVASPRAPMQLPELVKVGVQVGLLGLPVAALVGLGEPVAAGLLGAVTVLNAAVLFGIER